MSNGEQEMKDWSIGWYCIRAKPRQEMVASATLSTLDEVEVFLPRTQRARKAKSGPLKPLFPGYFFARFDPVEHLRNVHYARGSSLHCQVQGRACACITPGHDRASTALPRWYCRDS